MKNNYLMYPSVISFLISILLYSLSLYLSWYGTMATGIYLFLPTVLVVLVYLISTKTINKYPRATKIISNILNGFIIIFVQIFICGLMTLLFSGFLERDVTQIKDYQHALNSINNPESIKHFPKKIPEDATNIRLYKSCNNWFGSEEIYLIFNTNKEYILNELAKYKFQKIEGSYKNDEEYEDTFKSLGSYKLSKVGYKLYIIKLSKEPHNIFSYGIATNKALNEIMFYYNYPD